MHAPIVAAAIGGLRIDLVNWQASYKDKQVVLPDKLFRLLHRLAQNVGQPVAPDELHACVYKGKTRCEGIIQVNISRLRRALAKKCGGKNFIRAVRGKGYKLIDSPQKRTASWK